MSLPKPYYQDDAVTIYHGDCRSIAPRLARFDAVVTDPPYAETSLEWDRWPDGWPDSIVSLTDSLWCFGSMRMFWDRRDEFSSWRLAQDIIWEKHNGSGMAADRFRRVHELALHFYRGAWADIRHEVPRVQTENSTGPKSITRATKPSHFGHVSNGSYEYTDERLQRSVIRAASCHGSAFHPTEKPLSIVAPLISYSVPIGGVVLDPFGGSGTTGRAAKDMGRRAVLIEREERYCEIAAKRMAQEVLAL